MIHPLPSFQLRAGDPAQQETHTHHEDQDLSYLEDLPSLLLGHQQLMAVRYHGVHVHQPVPDLLEVRLQLLQTENKQTFSRKQTNV